MPDGASASTNSSTTAQAAVRLGDTIRLFKEERRAGVKLPAPLPPQAISASVEKPMAERRSAHTASVRRSPGWRAWIVVLTMALAGATLAEVICHEDHAVDQDCAVCQLRHQAAAESSESPQVGCTDVPEPIEPADDGGWIASDHERRLPARGPPA